MKTLLDTVQNVPSPCISLCQMDNVSGLCKACHRSIDEIIAWSSLQDDAKIKIWQLIEQRKEFKLS